MTRYIGKALPRREDGPFVTGRGQYLDDIAASGALHGAVLRAPHAHARILSIDAEAARKSPGVAAVYTARELEAAGVNPLRSFIATDPFTVRNADGTLPHDAAQYPLARDTVRYVGEPVAMVFAETAIQAQDAAELIEVEYEELPAVAGVDSALAADAPRLWAETKSNLAFDWQAGDAAALEEVFTGAAQVVEMTAEYPRIAAAFMEPRGASVEYDPDAGRFTVRTGCQSAHRMRDGLADILGIEPAAIHVLVPDTGGGFGARGNPYPEYAVMMAAARELGRPVKWIASRSEAFLTDFQARAQRLSGALALDADGNFLGVRLEARWRHGAYINSRAAFIAITWEPPMVCGPYRIPAHHFALKGVFTNEAPISSYRGVGRAEPSYFLERLIDKAARETGHDRLELRRRNLIAPAEMPWHAPTGAIYSNADLPGHLDAALAAIDWDGFDKRRARSEKAGRLRGIAVAPYIMNAGAAPVEDAVVRVGGGGTITVHVGTQDFGMSHQTVFGQVLAERFGVVPEAIRIVEGDSDGTRAGGGSVGSRSARMGGGAVDQGARKVIELGLDLASDMLEAAATDIEYEDGAYVVRGTDRRVGLFEVAAEAEKRDAPLRAEETYKVEEIAYPSGAHAAEVEVDPEIGTVDLVRFVTVSDPGTVLNPTVVEGQLHGSAAQAIGEALTESVVYEEGSGQLLSGSLMDYCLPRADDIPRIETALRPLPSDEPGLGAKGVGEGGNVATAGAVVNAVLDALAPLGVTEIEMPVTAERVWRAIRAAKT